MARFFCCGSCIGHGHFARFVLRLRLAADVQRFGQQTVSVSVWEIRARRSCRVPFLRCLRLANGIHGQCDARVVAEFYDLLGLCVADATKWQSAMINPVPMQLIATPLFRGNVGK